MERKGLIIGHLFPDLLNLYGDKGNILSLQNRLLWRGYEAEIVCIEENDTIDFARFDIVYLGGGSDRAELLVLEKLRPYRDALHRYTEAGGVLLATCGGYEMLGTSLMLCGQSTEGLSLLDVRTEAGPNRLIGNVVAETVLDGSALDIVGFENHSGRTFLGDCKGFAKIVSGFGNNGEDGTCGAVYRNVLGTHLHGPLLPKNPALTDYLLQRALLRKYGEAELLPLDDKAEQEAHDYACKRFGKE
ncbi:MAG: glutamine amidotransferase [Ruminococcaceae bacterium]|nr:glutamine amidotransferase [Oscillospiraceae bacterium]